jgi:hypothetical protein
MSATDLKASAWRSIFRAADVTTPPMADPTQDNKITSLPCDLTKLVRRIKEAQARVDAIKASRAEGQRQWQEFLADNDREFDAVVQRLTVLQAQLAEIARDCGCDVTVVPMSGPGDP